MARSRVRLNEEDLRLLTALGQKLYVRYDEGEILYSMGRNSFMKAREEIVIVSMHHLW